MVEGNVNSVYETVILLTLPGPAGQLLELECVVDIGFTGYLTLPPTVVHELTLPVVTSGMATLTDGSEVAFDTYEIAVLWHGRRRVIFADEAETTPLVGVMLLEGNDLNMQVRTGGRVLIQEIV